MEGKRYPSTQVHVLISQGRCILVDSTRKGKRIPDALSKTVPIWCSVINRAIQKHTPRDAWDACLHTLPSVVSRSEHAQIEARLDMFADRLLKVPALIERLVEQVKKPLRPLWLTPQSSLYPLDPDTEFWPVVCVSASQAVETGCQARPGGYLYVQGSGDDEEAWSLVCFLPPKQITSLITDTTFSL